MKIRFSIFILMISLLVTACGGFTQKEEGSLSVNAGKLARYLGESISRNDQGGRLGNNFGDNLAGSTYYGMRIEVYSEGDYKTSDEKVFKKSMEGCEKTSVLIEKLEELYKEAGKAELKLTGIPVGSVIKVHAKLTVGEMIDEQAYKEMLLAEGMPEEYVASVIAGKLEEIEENQDVVEGVSDEFEVKSGPNQVKIKIKAPIDLGPLFDESFDIILYTNVDDGNNNAIYNSKMFLEDSVSSSYDMKELLSLGDSKLMDFATDSQGKVYCITSNADDSKRYLTILNSGTSPSPIEIIEDTSAAGNKTSVAVDNETDQFFYGGLDENYFFLNTIPEVTSNLEEYEFNLSAIESNHSDFFDFAVSLGEATTSVNGETTTTTYNNAFVYTAFLKQTGDSTSSYSFSIFVIKKQFTYTITENGADITTNIVFSGTPQVLYLSPENDLDLGFHSNYVYLEDYYSVSDMIIHNGHLYLLLYNNITNSYSGLGSPYGATTIDDGCIKSNGALVSIALDDFSKTGVTVYGYEQFMNTSITTTGENPNNVDNPDCSITFTVKQPFSETANYFFGPRKFVAIRPKELVIADDGFFYYTDESNIFSHKNVDRLVVFDEEDSPQLQAYVLDSSSLIKFDSNSDSSITVSITGCWSSGYDVTTTCAYRQ